MNKKVYVTQGGLEDLRREYEELTKKKRPQVVARVSSARDMGDLSENAEYQAAREELSFVDGRIDELEELLKQATIINESNDKKTGKANIVLGSHVTLNIDGKKEVYMVVGEWEANPAERKISHESPLGKALMGKKIGEKVEVSAPAGKIVYTITEIN